ncbi:hypothetical protein N9S00_07035 [Luminiphilus sp.]|nr:hypothetical protein [Luminiphilus sp.]
MSDQERWLGHLIYRNDNVNIRAIRKEANGDPDVKNVWVSDTDAGIRFGDSLTKEGYDLYVTLNKPAACVGALKDKQVAEYRHLLFDFDVSEGATVDDACAARQTMIDTLQGLGLGIPHQFVSGRGAHAIYEISAPVAIHEAWLRSLYRAFAATFSTDTVKLDTTTSSPAQISRWIGYPNLRGGKEFRTYIELASNSAMLSDDNVVTLKQMATDHTALIEADRERVRTDRVKREVHRALGTKPQGGFYDAATFNIVAYFKDRGMYQRPLGGNKHQVRCPRLSQHTGGDDSGTIIFESEGKHYWPGIHCAHDSCSDYKIREFLKDHIDWKAYAQREEQKNA